MPFYNYRCSKCEEVFEQFHKMVETFSGPCKLCNEENTCLKIPTQITVKQDTGVGKIVEEFIRENKEITEQEKQKLSKQEYKK